MMTTKMFVVVALVVLLIASIGVAAEKEANSLKQQIALALQEVGTDGAACEAPDQCLSGFCYIQYPNSQGTCATLNDCEACGSSMHCCQGSKCVNATIGSCSACANGDNNIETYCNASKPLTCSSWAYCGGVPGFPTLSPTPLPTTVPPTSKVVTYPPSSAAGTAEVSAVFTAVGVAVLLML